MRIQALSIYTSDNSAQVGNDPLDSLSFLRSPEFAVPNDSPAYCSSIQVRYFLNALNDVQILASRICVEFNICCNHNECFEVLVGCEDESTNAGG